MLIINLIIRYIIKGIYIDPRLSLSSVLFFKTLASNQLTEK